CVCIDETAYHLLVKFFVHAQEIVWDAEGARDLPRVLDRLGAAAAAESLRRLLELRPRPDAHGHTDNVAPLVDQQGCGDGRVDSAAHPDDDAIRHLAPGVDLCFVPAPRATAVRPGFRRAVRARRRSRS